MPYCEKTEPVEKPLFISPGDIFGRGVGREGKGEGQGEGGERKGVRWNPQLVSYQRSLSPGGEAEDRAKEEEDRKNDEKSFPRSQRTPSVRKLLLRWTPSNVAITL